jgi:hypothetical protein
LFFSIKYESKAVIEGKTSHFIGVVFSASCKVCSNLFSILYELDTSSSILGKNDEGFDVDKVLTIELHLFIKLFIFYFCFIVSFQA